MPKIEQIFAFISVDKEPDDEGVVATKIEDYWLPFLAADTNRVDSLLPMAKQIAKITGKTIRLVKFTNRTELETITP